MTIELDAVDAPFTSFAATQDYSWDSLREEICNQVAFLAFKIASTLTEPVVKCHELARRFQVVDPLTEDPLTNLAQKVMICLAIASCAVLSTFTAFPGMALRAMASNLRSVPYFHLQGESPPKELPADRSFSLLTWNICGTPAGYSITDGGVMPWPFRIDAVIQKIIDQDRDVVCLNEVYDIQIALYIFEKLKAHGYSDFYLHMGDRVAGINSGLFVASKFAIAPAPEFIAFPLDTLVGRTKAAAKGVFTFDLESADHSRFATLCVTHLQHSEQPQFPIPEEVKGRKEQMGIILNKIDAIRDRCIVVTGDLNLDDDEMLSSDWHTRFQEVTHYPPNERTWGGDVFCSTLVDRQPVSGPLNLDHTLIIAGSAASIDTTLLSAEFDSTVFREEALSDHSGIVSRIKCNYTNREK